MTDEARPPEPVAPARRPTTGGPTGSWSSSPTRTTPTSGRRRPPRLDRPGLARLARLLHERRRGRRGRRRSIRSSSSATREAEQRAAADVVGYAGRELPPPARRGARQRPRPARAARPRDPDVPARRDPVQRPGDALLGGRRGQPHATTGRPASPRSTRSIRPPATRWRSRGSSARAWPPTGSAGCTCSGPRRRTPGSTSRRPSSARSRRCGPTPARSSKPDELGERAPQVDGRGGRPDRGGRPPSRSGSSSSTRTRPPTPSTTARAETGLAEAAVPARLRSRLGPALAPSPGPRLVLEEDRPDPAPGVPDLGQRVRPAAEDPDELAEGQAGRGAEDVLVGGHRDLAVELLELRLGSASAGPASGRGPRSRGRATRRAGWASARRRSRPGRRTGSRATTGRARCRGPGAG